MTTGDIHDMSRLIGQLEATITQGFKDVDRRFDEMNGRFNALPPSPKCVEWHDDFDQRMRPLETAQAEGAGARKVYGGFTIIAGASLGVLFQWFLDHMGFSFHK